MDITALKENVLKIKGKRGYVQATMARAVEIVGSASKTSFVIEKPGEYEVEGISVFAYAAGEGIAALTQVEEVKVLIVDQPLSDSLIEDMDSVDVVVLGTETVGSKELVELVGKIEPAYIIPVGPSERVEAFVKDFEHSEKTMDKLSLNRTSIATDVTEVVRLTT